MDPADDILPGFRSASTCSRVCDQVSQMILQDVITMHEEKFELYLEAGAVKDGSR